MAAEAKLTVRGAIGWSVLSSTFVFITTATWYGRGAYAELQSVQEATRIVSEEQREMKNQMWLFQQALTKSDERMEWIIKALERQERRSGYTPPPVPEN